jgi:proteasome assembly chaperone (PAC2) family protein
MTIEELAKLDGLQDPVLVAGFVTHRRAGRIGSRAAAYLVEQWKGRLVARIDAEDYMDLTVDRPEARYVSDVRTVKWPDTLIYHAHPDGADRDFLLLVGFEPNVRWRGFAGELSAYATAAGVRTIINIRGLQASVPHTRPTPVQLSASAPDLAQRFGLQAQRSKYEGPTDILGVLASYGQEQGWQTVDLNVLQPSYYPRMRNAAATIAVVSALDRAYGTKTSVGRLEARAGQQLIEIEQQAPPGEDFAAMVRGLEEVYDEANMKAEFLTPPSRSDLPTGEEMVDEIERLLRGFQGTDPGQ